MPKPYEFEDPSYVITSVVKQFTIVYDRSKYFSDLLSTAELQLSKHQSTGREKKVWSFNNL